MKFSVMKEKITPDKPVLQMGFSSRTHKNIGVHDDPYASVVLMQANETVIIIALDLVYGDKSFAYGIKRAISEKYGLSQNNIIISFSHTHSVVAVTGEDEDKRAVNPYSMNADGFLWGMDKKDVNYTEDIKYFNILQDKIMGMIDTGFNNLIEGDISICKGKSDFGVSRRFPSGNEILWKPYFDKNSMDMDLFLLKFIDKNKKAYGLIYNYACHPTTLGPDNYYISADYPGVVRRVLEEKNPGLTAVFLQGCGGDIKPYITADNGRFKSCNFDELEQAGTLLANKIQEYIEQPEWRIINPDFSTGYSDVKLYTEVWDPEKWNTILNNPDQPLYRKKSVEKILLDMKENRIKNYLPYYMSFFRLDNNTCMVCLEGEVVSDIGKEIKKIFNEDIIVLGYANSISCYIPTKKVLQDGGYERESFMGARLAGPFVPEVEDIIIGRAALMVKSGQ